jgi:hypothetical protein
LLRQLHDYVVQVQTFGKGNYLLLIAGGAAEREVFHYRTVEEVRGLRDKGNAVAKLERQLF